MTVYACVPGCIVFNYDYLYMSVYLGASVHRVRGITLLELKLQVVTSDMDAPACWEQLRSSGRVLPLLPLSHLFSPNI